MFFDDFMQRIKKGEIPSIVLFFGESEDVMSEAFQALKKLFLKRHAGGEIISFDAKNRFKEKKPFNISDSSLSESSDDLNDVLTAAQTNGLFSNDQLIVLKHAEKVLGGRSDKVVSQLKEYMDAPNSHSHLVFLASGLRKNATAVKVLEQFGWIVQCSDMAEWKIMGWLRSQASEKGLTLTEAGAQLMVEKIGMNVGCLKNALDQLAIFVSPQKNPTELEVRDLPVQGIEPEIFAFQDAFGMRRTEEVLKCLDRMGDKKDYRVIFSLYQRVRELLRIAVEKSHGVVQNEIAEKLRLHPFRIKQLWNQSLQFSPEELKSALMQIVRLQAGIVTGKISERLSGVMLQKLIMKWGREG
jgi:DNA polymerase III subunit delta